MSVNYDSILSVIVNIFRHLVSWKNICHLFFFTAAIICFLPSMLGYILDPSLEDDLYLYRLSEDKFHDSLVVSIAVTTVILIEKLIDSMLIYSCVPKPRTESDFITYFEFPIELLLIILAKDFVFILYIIPYQQYDFMTPLMSSQDILFTWFFIFNFLLNFKRIFAFL